MWCLTELLEGLYQTGRWPIGVYPGWLRYSMTYLVPIGFAITVPAEAVTSRLEWGTAVTALVFATARVHPLVSGASACAATRAPRPSRPSVETKSHFRHEGHVASRRCPYHPVLTQPFA
ncbi:hypothetical protein BH18ACT12_BH18ACT12_18620 [soil metagenome]